MSGCSKVNPYEEIQSFVLVGFFTTPYASLKAALISFEGELRLTSMHGIDLEMGAQSDAQGGGGQPPR